jgi:hypothetical protein
MGLGINIKGDVNTSLFELARIAEYIENHTHGLFKDFLSFDQNEDTLYVTVHPRVVSIYKNTRAICQRS